MQTIGFNYKTGEASFHLDLCSDGERITGSDLVTMGKYIRVLFATIRVIGIDNGSSIDVDAMLRELMGEDEDGPYRN
jgi:hypothetical protein